MCLYDVEERLLLRRVQVSANRSLDGVLDQLNSRHVTDAGPAALIDDAPSDEDEGLLPPTTAGGAPARLPHLGRMHACMQHAHGRVRHAPQRCWHAQAHALRSASGGCLLRSGWCYLSVACTHCLHMLLSAPEVGQADFG